MTDTRMVELDREECYRLLGMVHLGRVAVYAPNWGHPVIRPVTFRFHENSVVFRTDRGSKFTALLLSERAAFEVDAIDQHSRTGWSVIVTGLVEEVDNAAELHRLDRLGLEPWAPGDKPHWVRIRSETVSGRRIEIGSQ